MEITFKNISKSFIDSQRNTVHRIVKNLNFSISEKGIYCINGKSGIGKTTILNLISGILKPDSGQIIVKPSGMIAYSFQENLLLPWMNIKDNLLLTLSSIKEKTKEKKIEEIIRFLEYFQMESRANSFPSQLSGGQKQRINVIRSLLIESKIVLLDEPFSFLDTKNCVLLEKYLVDYSKKHKAIIIIATHKLPLKLKNIDQIFTLISCSNLNKSTRLIRRF